MEIETLQQSVAPESNRTESSDSAKMRWLWLSMVLVGLCVAVILILLAIGLRLNSPPPGFTSATVTVENGMSVQEVSARFKELHIVRSDTFLYFVLAVWFDPTEVKASRYVFESPVTTYEVARRLTEGDYDSDLVRFTHIEGERAEKIADTAERVLINFDRELFLSEALPYEGELFPDTYFVPRDYGAEELVELLHDAFLQSTAPLHEKLAASPLTLEQVIILASIIEREANSPESMRLVASVLLNRLSVGMPLQADASIEYVLDKPLKELTPEDLEVDSPYNTYLNPGLPPTPIGNPGLEAIVAVLEPANSDYFYYLTDDNGTFYYAKTYEQHLHNIELYLR